MERHLRGRPLDVDRTGQVRSRGWIANESIGAGNRQQLTLGIVDILFDDGAFPLIDDGDLGDVAGGGGLAAANFNAIAVDWKGPFQRLRWIQSGQAGGID